jgi:tetratricopeptide (TPR) repeat protein
MPLQAEGEFAQVKKRLASSLGLSGQPVKRGTMAHEHIVYMMLVDSAAAARDKPAILEFAPKLEELAVRDDHQPYLAVAYRAYGVAHTMSEEFEQAHKYLEKALHIFDELDVAWQRGRTLYELGQLARGRGDEALSQEMYTQALAEFEAIQAAPDAGRVKDAIGGS